LVRQGRVDIAVSDANGAALNSGADHRCDVLCPVRRIEQRFGPGLESPGLMAQQDLAELTANAGIAWLKGDDDVATVCAEGISQRLNLGALARALAALEGNE
jgi:hypothetical protein